MPIQHILTTCTSEEKLAYLQLVIFLAFSDHHLADDEAVFLEKITEIADLNTQEKERLADLSRHPEHINLQACTKTVSKSPLREILLIDLMIIARSDDEVATEERSAITQIAVLLGVPLDEVLNLTTAVNRNMPKYTPSNETPKNALLEKSMLAVIYKDDKIQAPKVSLVGRIKTFLSSLKK